MWLRLEWCMGFLSFQLGLLPDSLPRTVYELKEMTTRKKKLCSSWNSRMIGRTECHPIIWNLWQLIECIFVILWVFNSSQTLTEYHLSGRTGWRGSFAVSDRVGGWRCNTLDMVKSSLPVRRNVCLLLMHPETGTTGEALPQWITFGNGD